MNAPNSILEDLPFYLARASLVFRRFDDRTLRSRGIESMPTGMASVLHVLKERDGCAVNDLAKKTHIPNGTLTGLLDSLERKGHIIRTRSPIDGRSRIIRLKSSGLELCEKLSERHRYVMSLFGEALTQEESLELKRILGKLTHQMRNHTTEPSSTSSEDCFIP